MSFTMCVVVVVVVYYYYYYYTTVDSSSYNYSIIVVSIALYFCYSREIWFKLWCFGVFVMSNARKLMWIGRRLAAVLIR